MVKMGILLFLFFCFFLLFCPFFYFFLIQHVNVDGLDTVSFHFLYHQAQVFINHFFAFFRQMIQQGQFLEHDEHMGNFYGTPVEQLEEKLKTCHVVLDVEPVGAFNVRAKRPDAVLIFVAPPSRQVLEQRLRGRGDTGEEQIVMRLARADWEMEQSKRYDYVVINDQVEACADRILHIIAQEADR